MNTLGQDLRYGARLLLKKPGHTIITVVILAVAIGASTAIFSVVNGVLLRPLPFAEPERLVAVNEVETRNPAGENSASYPNFFDWRDRNQSFEQIAVAHSTNFGLTGTDSPANLSGQVVSAELFDLLGAKPQLGRVFTRADEKIGSDGVGRAVVISHALWRHRFAGDPKIIGRSLMLDRKPCEIVGVMKPGFQYPIQADPVEIWATSAFDAESVNGKKPITERRGYRMLNGIARLKAGVTIQQAQAEMTLITAAMEKEHPDSNANVTALLVPLHRSLVRESRRALLTLFAAVGCVLLIACANVAGLTLARATARRKEIAVRVALGAGRVRIIRQLLTESVLLSLLGGGFGLLLAWWGADALLKLIPENFPRLSEISIDLRVLGFSFGVSLLTGVVFGLAPALQASKIDLVEAMKESDRGGCAAGRSRLRGTLVVIEMALALTLLIGAGLLAQTFVRLQRVDLGFDAHNTLTASVALPETQYAKPEQRIAFFERLLERVRALPGVEKASAVIPMPLSGDDATGGFEIEGRPAPRGNELTTQLRLIGSDYYRTMKISFLAGRDFIAQDDLKAPPVAIVNDVFVKSYFPNEEPLGKRLKLPFGAESDSAIVEIIGVVKSVKHDTELAGGVDPELYMPYGQIPFFSQMSLAVRTRVEPGSLTKALQTEATALDREVVLNKVKTLEQYLGAAVAQPRLGAALLGLFAVVALLLAAIGLYSVMAYSVAQRTNEIGVRMALGAQTGNIVKMVIKQGMTLAMLGVAVGMAGAYTATRWMSALLFGVRPHDPLTFIALATLLALVALAACWVPARRAAKLDPMAALRSE